MDWIKLLTRAAAALGGVAGLALGLLYFLQEKIIYVPRLPGIPSDYPYLPDSFQMAFEDVWLTTADGLRLHAWLMWPPHWGEERRRSAPTVIFFQENAGNMAFRLPFLKPMTRLLDCNVFIFSYRGYGRSQGTPSEQGLRLDAECAVDHILRRTDLDPRRVVLFGRSLGGAVAAHAAVRRRPQVAGLVLENTFTRILDLVPHTMPFLRPLVGPGKPFNFLVRNHWNTKVLLEQLTDLPTLFLSALEDEMLPPAQMKELFEVHPKEPWSITYIEGARHLDAYDTHAQQYWPALQQFLHSLQPAQPLPVEPQEAGEEAPVEGKALPDVVAE